MEIITDNMYKNAIDKCNEYINSCIRSINNRTQVVVFDFDVYVSSNDIYKSVFYTYIDNLPPYCSKRLNDLIGCAVICIKHLNVCLLTSV
jgi:hypothetical protein